MKRARRDAQPRGVVLLAVLVIVTLGAFIGAGLLTTAGAEAAGAEYSARRAQSRALAWSGVQAVATTLAAQRDRMMDGERPELEGEYALFRDEYGRRGVVRFTDLGSGDVIESEAGKLDLNHASEEMLAKLPGVGADLAKLIVAARESRPFASVAELTRVDGIDDSMLEPAAGDALGGAGLGFGDPLVSPGRGASGGAAGAGDAMGDGSGDAGGAGVGRDGEGAGGAGAPPGVPPSATPADLGGPADGTATGLARLVTVFAFDPNVQMGLADEERKGSLRFPLTALPDDIDLDTLREEAPARTREAMQAGWLVGQEQLERPEDDEASVRQIGIGDGETPATSSGSDSRTEVEMAEAALDWSTTEEDLFRLGRVDVNAAPAEVLACVPGISGDAAARIVSLRERLGAEERRSPLWILREGAVSDAEMAQAVNHLTTRSLQWRVRLEAGFLPATEEGERLAIEAAIAERDEAASGARSGAEAALLGGAMEEPEAKLEDRVVLEVVFDLGTPRARVAYMRDVTLAALATRLRAERARLAENEPSWMTEPEFAFSEDDRAVVADADADSGTGFGGPGMLGSGVGGSDFRSRREGGDDAGGRTRTRSPSSLGQRPPRPQQSGEGGGGAGDSSGEGGAEGGGAGAGGGGRGGGSGGGGGGGATGTGFTGMVDRRTGRWTTGSGG